MHARVLAAVAAALLLQAPAALRVEEVRFRSTALGREMPYRVLLPAGYETSSRRYGVLYLLHGLDGDYTNWTSRTKLAQHAAASGVIIVTPEGGNSWYVDRWEEYVVRDLVDDVDRRFRTEARRASRYIAGFSMGGYGALRIGLKHPARFAFAGSMSGALNITRLDTYGWTDALRAEFTSIFGPMGSARRREDDVFEIARRAPPEGLPFFYIDCGSADPFLPGNRELAAILQERKIPYEFRETPGVHNWVYWDRQVAEVLRIIGAGSQ